MVSLLNYLTEDKSSCVKMGLGTHKVKLESLEKLKDSRRPQDFLCLEVFFACVQQRDGDLYDDTYFFDHDAY